MTARNKELRCGRCGAEFSHQASCGKTIHLSLPRAIWQVVITEHDPDTNANTQPVTDRALADKIAAEAEGLITSAEDAELGLWLMELPDEQAYKLEEEGSIEITTASGTITAEMA